MHLQGTGTKADQPNMFPAAANELVPFLVCWEFEETLKDYFLVREQGSLRRLTTAVTTFLECLLG